MASEKKGQVIDKYKDLNMFSRSDSLNNFSYWFPKIENCGMLVPKSQIFPVPQQMLTGGVFYMEHAERMLRNHHLAKAIADASWASFVRMLECQICGSL